MDLEELFEDLENLVLNLDSAIEETATEFKEDLKSLLESVVEKQNEVFEQLESKKRKEAIEELTEREREYREMQGF